MQAQHSNSAIELSHNHCSGCRPKLVLPTQQSALSVQTELLHTILLWDCSTGATQHHGSAEHGATQHGVA